MDEMTAAYGEAMQAPGGQANREIENIALSLSGGGVRAVGFHLGLLATLHRLDLLNRVSILSTVSGGSLTGIGYALSQRFGHRFDRFFGEFYEFLPNINTIEVLLDGLSSADPPSPSGRRDMIAVLANLYDDAYFKKYFGEDVASSQSRPEAKDGDDPAAVSPRFDVFWDEDHPDNHLKEVVFNATEFQTGTAFRFQKSEFRALIGNANIFLCEEHARQLRMADIMAASCCIPVGMEPMFFPDDFHWPDDVGSGLDAHRPTCDTIKDHLRENLHQKFRIHGDAHVDFFALMDGGVYDNQGIVSLLLAMNRLITKVQDDAPPECVCGKSLFGGYGEPDSDEWARIIAGQVTPESERDFGSLENVGWEDVDLLIVSDTPVRKDSVYPKLPASMNPHNPEDALNLEPPFSSPPKGGLLTGLTVGGTVRVLQIATFLMLASAAVTGWHWWYDASPGIPTWTKALHGLLRVGIPLALTAGLEIGLIVLHKRLIEMSAKLYGVLPSDRWVKDPWKYLRRLKLTDVMTMISLRVSSTSALTASIYMNRIRSLSYSALFSRRDLESHVITNEIFSLERCESSKPSDWPEDFPAHIPLLSEDASAIITLAAHMQTKLWINRIDKGVANYADLLEGDNLLTDATKRVLAMNEKREGNSLAPLNDLDVLVISGQLTGCFNIMVHLWQQHRGSDGSWKFADSQRVFEKALDSWMLFHDDPTTLLEEQKRDSEVERHSRTEGAQTVVID